jgi:hypothetical protein
MKKAKRSTPEQRVRIVADAKRTSPAQAAKKHKLHIQTIYTMVARAKALKPDRAKTVARINKALALTNGDAPQDIKGVVGVLIDADIESNLIATVIDQMRAGN